MSAIDDALTGFIAASKQAKAEGMIDREDVVEVVRGVKEARAELTTLRSDLARARERVAELEARPAPDAEMLEAEADRIVREESPVMLAKSEALRTAAAFLRSGKGSW